MALRVSCFWASSALLLTVVGCDKKTDEPPAPAHASSAAMTASASGAKAAPSASVAPSALAPISPVGEPSAVSPASSAEVKGNLADAKNLCERVLTANDIKSVCGTDSSAANAPIVSAGAAPPAFVCSHRFTLGERSLQFTLNGLTDPVVAKKFFDETKHTDDPEFKKITGVGEDARRYISFSLTNDLNHTVELRKGIHTIKVITPKITSNGRDLAPLCTLDQLEALGKLMASRL